MDGIEVKGQTVEEAIEEGLKQLQVTREDVVIEIVQQERKSCSVSFRNLLLSD